MEPNSSLTAGQGLLGVHVPGDHHDGVVGGVPGVVKLLQHGPGGLVEGGLGPQRVMGVGRPLEHGRQQPAVKDILRVGQVLGHLLLDGPPLLVPELVAVQHVPHAVGLDVQGHLQVVGRHRKEILGYGLLGVGVEFPPHARGDVGQLVGAEPRAPPEHHVLLGVGHPREPRRRLVRARQVVHHDGGHRRQLVLHDHHPQAVVQGGPGNFGGRGFSLSFTLGLRRRLLGLFLAGHQARQQAQQDEDQPATRAFRNQPGTNIFQRQRGHV